MLEVTCRFFLSILEQTSDGTSSLAATDVVRLAFLNVERAGSIILFLGRERGVRVSLLAHFGLCISCMCVPSLSV